MEKKVLKRVKRKKEKTESKCQTSKNIDHNFRWFSGQMGAFSGLLAILNSKNRHDDRSWLGRVMRGRIGDTFNKPPADDSQEINRESIREGRPRENYVVAWYISHSPWINVSPILPRCIKSLQPFSHQTLPKNWPALMHWEQTVAWVRVADEMYRFVLVACSYAITYTFFFCSTLNLMPDYGKSWTNILVDVGLTCLVAVLIKHQRHDWFPRVRLLLVLIDARYPTCCFQRDSLLWDASRYTNWYTNVSELLHLYVSV